MRQEDYNQAIAELSKGAAPLMNDLPFLIEDGSQETEDRELYLPASGMTINAQVVGMVVAFLHEVALIIFKNGTFKKPKGLRLLKIGVLAVKLVWSVVKAARRQ